MIIPLIPLTLSFGTGWYARDKGVSAETSALLGTASAILWLTRSYTVAPVVAGGLWVAKDVGAGLLAGSRAAVGASSVMAATAAVVVPTAIGYGVSTLIAGEEGGEQYTDFVKTAYTDPVEAVYMLDEALEAAYTRFDDTAGITRAPANNAAGLPEGTTEWEINNPHVPINPFTGHPNRAYQG